MTEPKADSLMLRSTSMAANEPASNSQSQGPKQHPASVAKHLTGHSSYNASTSSLLSQSSFTHSPVLDTRSHKGDTLRPGVYHSHSHTHHDPYSRLVSQVQGWLHEEKEKHSHKAQPRSNQPLQLDEKVGLRTSDKNGSTDGLKSHEGCGSSILDDGSALEKLEQILAENLAFHRDSSGTPSNDNNGSYFPRRTSPTRKLRKGSAAVSSDTEYLDGDAVVPSAEVVLDNSKTLSYGGGGADSAVDQSTSNKRTAKERDAWLLFKSEIVRLAHTLRLKGWRRVPLTRGGDIDVERLSGALTNAVYVVSPPKNLPSMLKDGEKSSTSLTPKKPPPKLLLRIYGPQVEHLIDRESELQILRRLARKKIGPRLLGTFLNGRFEEFFYARTLTAPDLRIPETSKQIAKRMRELHDGIELLEEERDAGPFVWRNWDKWVARCEDVIMWVDNQIISGKQGVIRNASDEWKKRGLVCGVEWRVFRKSVENYRTWLDQQCGGKAKLSQQLVFAHNDTQYGNLLRLQPSGESPLLLPANSHKQLVVIDFEYASANMRGLEFANHFTEWCYNYHDTLKPHGLNALAYPSPEEQRRFLKAYVQHRPQFHPAASSNPAIAPSSGPSSSVSGFMLDSRTPPAPYAEEEKRREEETEREVESLIHEARLWRVANSAQWVAWGIVQAKVDGMDEALDKAKNRSVDDAPTENPPTVPSSSSTTTTPSNPLPSTTTLLAPPPDTRPEGLIAEALASGNELSHDDDDEGEFDYLGYAQERALFFWGDVLGLGLVKREDLPAALLERIKVVDY